MGETKKKPQNPNKLLNAIRTLTFIRKNRETDALTISERLGIALPTLYRSLKYLLEQKLIIEDGKGYSSAGRRAVLYSVNDHYAYVLGIYIGKKYIQTFIAGIDGTLRQQHITELKPGLQRDEILGVIHKAVDTVAEKCLGAQEKMARIHRIGIMSASAVDVLSGTITEFGGRECLNGFPIVAHMEARYGKPVKLMKESSICALSYADEMAGKHISHYLYVHIGLGVSASLVVDGQLYGGKHGCAGEIEKIPLPENRRSTPLTMLEVYERVDQYICANPASALAELVAQKRQAGHSRETALLRSIDESIAGQDADCIGLLRATVEAWRMMICVLLACYDPECCILGGDISDNVPALYRWIKGPEQGQTAFMPGHSGNTNNAVLARSTIDEVFADLQKEISAM